MALLLIQPFVETRFGYAIGFAETTDRERRLFQHLVCGVPTDCKDLHNVLYFVCLFLNSTSSFQIEKQKRP